MEAIGLLAFLIGNGCLLSLENRYKKLVCLGRLSVLAGSPTFSVKSQRSKKHTFFGCGRKPGQQANCVRRSALNRDSRISPLRHPSWQ
jgi:hypothetical protein